MACEVEVRRKVHLPLLHPGRWKGHRRPLARRKWRLGGPVFLDALPCDVWDVGMGWARKRYGACSLGHGVCCAGVGFGLALLWRRFGLIS